MLLAGKNALVTGASRGIGAAIVAAFAAEGANVWALARTRSEAFEATLAGLAAAHGVWLKPLYADVSDPAAVSAAIRLAMADKQPLDILVNNAGAMAQDKPFQLTALEEMEALFRVNFFGAVQLSQLATRWMARKGCGAVVNLASIAGINGGSRLDYSASKAAIISATKTMARELAPLGIRVNAVAPGFIQTDMTQALGQQVQADTIAKTLLRRAGTPEDVAQAVTFLASDRAAYITAQIWGVDGGML